MRLGFRAGIDQNAGISSADDFAGTMRSWRMPEAAGTLLGRVFPSSPFVGGHEQPAAFVGRLDRAAAPVVAAGMLPFLSFKPAVADTAAGDMDALYTAVGRWAATMPTPVYMTVWHEPENDTMDAGQKRDHANHVGRARNFVAVYSRAYQLMKAAAGDQLRMGPVHMIYHWRQGSPTTSAGKVAVAWQVPEHLRDFIAADTYTSNWSLKGGAKLRVKKDFQRWRTTLEVPDDQILLAERGITRNPPGVKDGPTFQANVLTDDVAYLNGIGAQGLVYWNSGGATDDSIFLLGQPARAAFAFACTAL